MPASTSITTTAIAVSACTITRLTRAVHRVIVSIDRTSILAITSIEPPGHSAAVIITVLDKDLLIVTIIMVPDSVSTEMISVPAKNSGAITSVQGVMLDAGPASAADSAGEVLASAVHHRQRSGGTMGNVRAFMQFKSLQKLAHH